MSSPAQRLSENSRSVAFAYEIGTNRLLPVPMNSDGSIRIEIHPTAIDTAIATRHRIDENSRWTSFGLDSTGTYPTAPTLPLTMTNLGGTAPAVRIDINVL